MALALLSACSQQKEEQQRDASTTGGIAAQAQWPEAEQSFVSTTAFSTLSNGSNAPYRSAEMPASVITVRFLINASDMEEMTKDFDATLHQGTIKDVPVGDNRILTLQGLNSSNTVVFAGESQPITVVAGQTADAGTIPMTPALPPAGATVPSPVTGVTATANSGSVGLFAISRDARTKLNSQVIVHALAPLFTIMGAGQLLGIQDVINQLLALLLLICHKKSYIQCK